MKEFNAVYAIRLVAKLISHITALSTNKIAFLYAAETSRLKKIIHKTRSKDLCRRATAVLQVLKGKTKAEAARLLQAGRSA